MAVRSWSVRVWLIALGGLGILPLLVLALWFSAFEYREERARVLTRVLEIARALTQAVDGRFEARIALLEGLATANSLRDGRFDDFFIRASDALRSLPPGGVITVRDAEGRLLMTTADAAAPKSQEGGDGVRAVFASGEPQISNVRQAAGGGAFVVSVDVPVYQDGRVMYALSIVFPVEELWVLVRAQRISRDWYIGINDQNAVLAARLPDPERYVGKASVGPLVEAFRGQAEGHLRTVSLDGVEIYSTWSRSPFSGWTVAIALRESILAEPLRRRVAALAIAGGATLLAVLGFGLLLGRAISRRMVRLADGAAAIASDRPTVPPPRGIREVDTVDQAIRQAAQMIREQEARQRLLLGELDHRVKNMLATVQALINRTLGRTAEAKTLTGRVSALAHAHALLARTQGRSAPLRDIVSITLEAHRGEGRRIVIDGPDILLNPRAAQGLALALHELATNAVKHGALSVSGGMVGVYWRITGTSTSRCLELDWIEQGGPPVVEPSRRGFGSILIERMPQELDGTVTLRFLPRGVTCGITMPAAEITAEGSVLPEPFVAKPAGAVALRGRRVLLVEDSALVAMESMQALEEAGCQVQTAGDLAAALALARTADVDAAVLDVNLNGEMVFPAAYALRERHIPFLFLTGYDDARLWPEDLRRETRISKPLQAEELLAALRNLGAV